MWPGRARSCGEDGDGAVGGADAGRNADARVDGLGKSGAVRGSVDGRHEREVQLIAAVFGEGHAHQAAAVLGHEVDGFGGDFLGGYGQVAFVLAVLVVYQHNHAALANFLHGFFHSSKGRLALGHREKDFVLLLTYKEKKKEASRAAVPVARSLPFA